MYSMGIMEDLISLLRNFSIDDFACSVKKIMPFDLLKVRTCKNFINLNFIFFIREKFLISNKSNGSIFWLIVKKGWNLDKKIPPGTNTKSHPLFLKYELENKI